jgi:hypothetical protein
LTVAKNPSRLICTKMHCAAVGDVALRFAVPRHRAGS